MSAPWQRALAYTQSCLYHESWFTLSSVDGRRPPILVMGNQLEAEEDVSHNTRNITFRIIWKVILELLRAAGPAHSLR